MIYHFEVLNKPGVPILNFDDILWRIYNLHSSQVDNQT